MPASSPLMRNFVCRMPVVAPAMQPPTKLARLANHGLVPCTSSTAAIAAPSVVEPSAVMSGKRKTRKLMKTPSASSERMRPTLHAPSSSVMSLHLPDRLRYRCDRADPASAAGELALTDARALAVVAQEMQHALQGL